MNYLYLILGLAMISGISAMMKIGNNINNLMLLSTFKESDYIQSDLPTYDRKIMAFLDNYTGADIDVCSFIKEKFSDTLYENGEIFLSSGKQTPSSNSLFLGSCVLVNKDINHRVIIKKNNVGTYNLFSCYLKGETFCPYEVNK